MTTNYIELFSKVK